MENTISMDEYKEIEKAILKRSEVEIIETHKNLIGKSCKSKYDEIKDCGVELVRYILSREWEGLCHYYEGAVKFINSKYLSDYFKNSIKELLSTEELSEETINVLNSNKLINDMSEEELKIIYYSIKDFYEKREKREITNIASSFMSYLYKLNGEGVISFIKNNISNTELARNILRTSGLYDRASYYSGRGVDRADLNEKNLYAIFKKLLKLDENYAIQFARMIKKMKTLGATEFINTFMNFASNDFNVDNLEVKNSNYSLDGLYGKIRDDVAMLSASEAMIRGHNRFYQISASEEIKSSFLLSISPTLMRIDYGYDYKYDNFSIYGHTPYRNPNIKRR